MKPSTWMHDEAGGIGDTEKAVLLKNFNDAVPKSLVEIMKPLQEQENLKMAYAQLISRIRTQEEEIKRLRSIINQINELIEVL